MKRIVSAAQVKAALWKSILPRVLLKFLITTCLNSLGFPFIAFVSSKVRSSSTTLKYNSLRYFKESFLEILLLFPELISNVIFLTHLSRFLSTFSLISGVQYSKYLCITGGSLSSISDFLAFSALSFSQLTISKARLIGVAGVKALILYGEHGIMLGNFISFS